MDLNRLRQRIVSRVEIDSATGCWNWTGPLTHHGYARFWVNKRNAFAHRVAYELSVGAIPPGLFIDHLCRNRRCCNAAHLRVVTTRENLMASDETKATKNARKTHCVRGHPFDDTNTAVRPNGDRRCRACHRDDMRAHNAQRKSELMETYHRG